MQFLMITRRKTESFTHDQFSAELDAEGRQACQLYTDGLFRTIWTRGDIPGAIAVVEADDLAGAEAIVATLPFKQKGMMDTELIPLKPYRGFAPR
ncbi:MAG TPA: hypothetical protein VGZ00_05520 [Candidatus Baltobacteraceae bacterium]|jgi:hypothetical protein|nr:hypothetical protein [Candidatus Baltobacteraceae bacterium]